MSSYIRNYHIFSFYPKVNDVFKYSSLKSIYSSFNDRLESGLEGFMCSAEISSFWVKIEGFLEVSTLHGYVVYCEILI